MAEKIEDIAQAMVAKGKGILAADESSGTITKRFDALGITSTEDGRRDYREMLFRAEAMKTAVSGVILYDETIRQKAKDGTPLVDLIKAAGAVPGIKVDTGAKDLAFSPGEKITEGLDGLRERLKEYYELGARFAKWRAVIDIGPGDADLELHQRQCPGARPLRRALPGGRHRADRRAGSADGRPGRRPTTSTPATRATEWILKTVFQELYVAHVEARGHGAQAEHGGSRQEERRSRLRPPRSPRRPCSVLKECVPAAVAGIAFLSGGQSDEAATEHLSLINQIGGLPWPRHLLLRPGAPGGGDQDLGRKGGERRPPAQRAFNHRAQMNSLAATGDWKPDLEKKAA